MNFGDNRIANELKQFLMFTPSNEMIETLDDYCDKLQRKLDLNDLINDRNELKLVHNILLNNHDILSDTVWHTPHETLFEYLTDRHKIKLAADAGYWLQIIERRLKEYDDDIERLADLS